MSNQENLKELADFLEIEIEDLKPTNEELTALIKPLIPEPLKGDKGDDGDSIKGDKGDKPVAGVDYPIPKNGVDGVSPDPHQIALEASKLTLDELKPQIPTVEQIELDIPKLGSPIRDALELLQGDYRLDKSAIKGLPEELERIIGMISQGNLNIGGGLSIPRTVNVDDETPTGTINGSNTSFTINYVPINGSVKVFRGGARQTVTEDYTISGQTITFLIAPQVGEIIRADYRR